MLLNESKDFQKVRNMIREFKEALGREYARLGKHAEISVGIRVRP